MGRSLFLAGAAVAAAAFASQAGAVSLGQASTPAGSTFASACAGLGFSGGGTAGDNAARLTNSSSANCGEQTSAFGGSASATASNSGTSDLAPFTNSATSAAGPKSIHLQAANSGTQQSAFPAGVANGGFSDELTVNSTTLTGNAILIVPINVLGTITATGVGADGILSVAAFENQQMITESSVAAWDKFNLLNDPLYKGSPSGESWDFENVQWRAVDFGPTDSQTLTTVTVNSTVFFAVPVVIGTAFDLGIYASVAAGEASAGGTDTPPNDTTLAFQNTIAWGGQGYLLAADGSGPEITNFTISSATGTDYSTAFSEGVPEPGAWALMLTGFAGLGAALRRRRSALRLRTAC